MLLRASWTLFFVFALSVHAKSVFGPEAEKRLTDFSQAEMPNWTKDTSSDELRLYCTQVEKFQQSLSLKEVLAYFYTYGATATKRFEYDLLKKVFVDKAASERIEYQASTEYKGFLSMRKALLERDNTLRSVIRYRPKEKDYLIEYSETDSSQTKVPSKVIPSAYLDNLRPPSRCISQTSIIEKIKSLGCSEKQATLILEVVQLRRDVLFEANISNKTDEAAKIEKMTGELKSKLSCHGENTLLQDAKTQLELNSKQSQ